MTPDEEEMEGERAKHKKVEHEGVTLTFLKRTQGASDYLQADQRDRQTQEAKSLSEVYRCIVLPT